MTSEHVEVAATDKIPTLYIVDFGTAEKKPRYINGQFYCTISKGASELA